MTFRTLLLAALVACGDDDTPSGTDTTPPTDEPTPTTDDTDPTTDPTTDVPTDTPPAEPPQQLVTNTLPRALFSLTGTSSSDVWVVGAADDQGGQLWHFDGAAWTRADASAMTWDFWWVWDDGAGTLVIGGSAGHVARYNKALGTFEVQPIADPSYVFFGVWGSAPDDVWAVAGDPSSALDGAIYHYDGSDWTLSTLAPPANGSHRNCFKVWGRAADDVTVVGTGTLTLHWDGSTWDEVASPLYKTIPLFTVAGDSTDTIVVGGTGNAAAELVDSATETATDATPGVALLAPNFIGVYDTDDQDPIASAGNGTLWWYRGTMGWEVDPHPPATSDGLHAVWVDPDGGIWAVGGDLTSLNHGTIVYVGNRTIPSP